MSLKFAFLWNKDYRTGGTIKINGKNFGYDEARTVLRLAVIDPLGAGLKTAINDDVARVINGPHRSEADTRVHMTVHCLTKSAIYHVYVSQSGNYSGIGQGDVSAISPKTGNSGDDWHAPKIDDVAAL